MNDNASTEKSITLIPTKDIDFFTKITALKSEKNIKHLIIKDKTFSQKELDELGDALNTLSLDALELINCKISRPIFGEFKFTKFQNGLGRQALLTTLNIDGSEVLAETVFSVLSSKGFSIQTLDVSNIELSTHHTNSMLTSLCTILKAIHENGLNKFIAKNIGLFWYDDLEMLISSLKNKEKLTQLIIIPRWIMTFNVSGTNLITELISKNSQLTNLVLQKTQFSMAGFYHPVKAILKTLAQNNSLIKFEFATYNVWQQDYNGLQIFLARNLLLTLQNAEANTNTTTETSNQITSALDKLKDMATPAYHKINGIKYSNKTADEMPDKYSEIITSIYRSAHIATNTQMREILGILFYLLSQNVDDHITKFEYLMHAVTHLEQCDSYNANELLRRINIMLLAITQNKELTPQEYSKKLVESIDKPFTHINRYKSGYLDIMTNIRADILVEIARIKFQNTNLSDFTSSFWLTENSTIDYFSKSLCSPDTNVFLLWNHIKGQAANLPYNLDKIISRSLQELSELLGVKLSAPQNRYFLTNNLTPIGPQNGSEGSFNL